MMDTYQHVFHYGKPNADQLDPNEEYGRRAVTATTQSKLAGGNLLFGLNVVIFAVLFSLVVWAGIIIYG